MMIIFPCIHIYFFIFQDFNDYGICPKTVGVNTDFTQIPIKNTSSDNLVINMKLKYIYIYIYIYICVCVFSI